MVPCWLAGRTLMTEATVAGENISLMVTTVPTGNKPFWTQYPAGTTKLAPFSAKENRVPAVTPGPATLQTLTRPNPPAVLVKSTSVSPVPTVTPTVPADRSAAPSRSAGTVSYTHLRAH